MGLCTLKFQGFLFNIMCGKHRDADARNNGNRIGDSRTKK